MEEHSDVSMIGNMHVTRSTSYRRGHRRIWARQPIHLKRDRGELERNMVDILILYHIWCMQSPPPTISLHPTLPYPATQLCYTALTIF